jgi:hypothetical protein
LEPFRQHRIELQKSLIHIISRQDCGSSQNIYHFAGVSAGWPTTIYVSLAAFVVWALILIIIAAF